jgi:hypothetical protein
MKWKKFEVLARKMMLVQKMRLARKEGMRDKK